LIFSYIRFYCYFFFFFLTINPQISQYFFAGNCDGLERILTSEKKKRKKYIYQLIQPNERNKYNKIIKNKTIYSFGSISNIIIRYQYVLNFFVCFYFLQVGFPGAYFG
jgi:hypothetical protein